MIGSHPSGIPAYKLFCGGLNAELAHVRPLLAETSRWWHRVASVRYTPKPAAQVLEFGEY